ncbi:uncharacterized protein LOC131284340 [Anopheles ziemanni]|uniref:uncharacterized protein LOC131272595 n=1 Tax=Anopheles coustani TaxID=139045 RepID=UPI002659ECF0|nr:uncharacterized protein LOC131272595 [Anopheles coustani]XP_058169179.1 uncharacterized protein LOC131284340 [Anopheles ziemanni]
MIFGDLVCCVHFVVLFQSCTGAALAAAAAAADSPSVDAHVGTVGPWIVASAQVRQAGPGLAPNNRTAGRYTNSQPGELNEYCRTSQDCRQHAHDCDGRKQTCTCAEGYRPDETNRVCLGAVGRRCLYDSHCITNAYCKGQMICTCKREYGFLADDNWSCQASSGKASPRIGTSRIGGFYELRRLLPLLVASGSLWTICKRHT